MTNTHATQYSSATPVWRLRKDVRWIRQDGGGRWVAHDPIANAFYYFSDLEHDALQMLDGISSLEQLTRRLNQQLRHRWISVDWLATLIQRVAGSELLLAGGSVARGTGLRFPSSRNLLSRIANPLAIRIPLIRTPREFDACKAISRLVFSKRMMIFGLGCFALTTFLVLAQMLSHPERAFYDIGMLQGDRWIGLFVMLLVIKSLHEFGHYLAALRWNAGCQEIGVLLLCFSPCLYCDTTHTWALRSKWKRVAIAAAGIYVEMWLAVLGGVLYLATTPGLSHTLGAVMFLTCTLGTLLVNGNPCFRYDGYYILSDLWGVPNLAQQSSAALWDVFIYLLGGRKPESARYDKSISVLAIFALGASLYRLTIVGVIIVFVWQWLVPMGFGLLAIAVLGSMAISYLAMVRRGADALLTETFSERPIRLFRLAALAAILGLALWVAFWVPIPHWVRTCGYVEFQNATPMYASETGVLIGLPEETRLIQAGETLVQLDSIDKAWERLRVQGALELVSQRSSLLATAQATDAGAAFELPALRESQSELQAKLAILDGEIARLHLRASEAGQFVPNLDLLPYAYDTGEVVHRIGHAVSLEHRGLRVERGTLLGWFVPIQPRFQVRALMDDADSRLLQVGDPCTVQLDSRPWSVDRFEISGVADDIVSKLPRELVGDPRVIASQTADGSWRPTQPARSVLLVPETGVWTADRGAIATVRIQLPGRTIWQWLCDSVAKAVRTQPSS